MHSILVVLLYNFKEEAKLLLTSLIDESKLNEKKGKIFQSKNFYII